MILILNGMSVTTFQKHPTKCSMHSTPKQCTHAYIHTCTHTLGTHTCTRQHTQLLKFNTCSTPTCNELKPPSVVPGYLMVQIANYLVISIHTTHSPFILTLIYQLLLERERERERAYVISASARKKQTD